MDRPKSEHKQYRQGILNPRGDPCRSANAPGRIRTCDLRIRSPLLYPAELRAPDTINQITTAKGVNNQYDSSARETPVRSEKKDNKKSSIPISTKSKYQSLDINRCYRATQKIKANNTISCIPINGTAPLYIREVGTLGGVTPLK